MMSDASCEWDRVISNAKARILGCLHPIHRFRYTCSDDRGPTWRANRSARDSNILFI
jgi:hypothetical protein